MLCLLAPALSRTDIRHAKVFHSPEAAASLWEMTVFSSPALLLWVTRKETYEKSSLCSLGHRHF